MRLMVDATAARELGAATDYRGLLPALARNERVEELIVVVPSTFQLPGESLDRISVVHLDVPEGLARFVVLNRKFAELVRARKADAVVFGLFAPVMSRSGPYALRFTNATLVDPESRARLRYVSPKHAVLFRARARYLRWSARRATVIVCPTKAAADLLVKWQPGLAPKVVAAPFGPPEPPSERKDGVVSGHGMSLLGMHVRPHKNLGTVVRALALPGMGGCSLTLLRTTTTSSSKYEEFLRTVMDEAGVASRIRWVDQVPGWPEVQRLMLGHDAVIVPSMNETWSHTVVEALALGIPTLASDIAVHREVAGNALWLFDPAEPRSVRRTIREVLERPEAVEEKRSAGYDVVSRLSWDVHAAAIVKGLLKEI